MVWVHIFCTVATNKRKLLERVYTCCALADNHLRSRAYSIVVAIKRRNGENYDHKQACNDVQVTVNAAYGSRFLERTPRSFSNNRCLCYDDCATMLAWCLQIDIFTNSITYMTLLEGRSYGDSKKHGLLVNGGYSTFVYHRWSICCSSLKVPDKG